MAEPSKMEFRHRRISQLQDLTDLAEMLFPGNRNQQHAAGRILLDLKSASDPVASLAHLQDRHGVSRRTLERTRAKLAHFGLIEHMTWMNSRHGGQEGWKLSGRMSTALRQLADKIDQWRSDDDPKRLEKDEMLVGLLVPRHACGPAFGRHRTHAAPRRAHIRTAYHGTSDPGTELI